MTDQRLEKALEFANYRSTLANQKEKLKDRCEAQLNYAYNGGIFHINETLIAFIDSFCKQDKKSMVMLDSNKNIYILEFRDYNNSSVNKELDTSVDPIVYSYFKTYWP